MKIFIYTFIACLIPVITLSQSYQTGNRSLTFTDASRSNRQIPADIYYPADSRASGVSVASGNTTFPVVVFGHGFSLAGSSYSRLADSLVSYGYVVVLPATETGLAPSHDNFGKDIAFLADAVTALGTDNTSFLYQRVINKAAVSGHSMGGGCSFLAAATGNLSIKALFNFAAAETTPSATAAASSVNVPALVFSGSSDCIVPPATQLAMYNNIPSTCKTYINITGGTHCQIANNNATCTFGQLTSGCNSSSITVDIFLNTSLYLLLPFLDYHLKGNCYRGITFIDRYNNVTGITAKQNTCPPPVCNPLAVNFIDLAGRFSAGKVYLQWDTEQEGNVTEYSIEKSSIGTSFDEFGRKPASGNQQNHYEAEDNLPFPQSTYYRIKALNADGSFKYSNIINITVPRSAVSFSPVFPNPAGISAGISIQSISDEDITLQLISATGSLVHTETIRAGRGSGTFSFSVQKFSAGVYALVFRNSEGEIIRKERLLIQ